MLGQTTPAPPLRVLVGDHPDGARSLAALVRLWGHDARPAYNLREVLGGAAAFRPDVIVIEPAIAPGAAHLAIVARALRLRAEPCRLVAVTAHAPTEVVRRFPGIFDRCLRKPVFQGELQAILAAAPRLPGP
jgi:DNA-binding response OmpR family regulator